MKKFSKVVLALVLCVACLAMTACSKSDEQKVVGKWDTDIDLSKMMMGSDSDSDAEAMTKYFSDGLPLTVTFNFNDDKSGSFEVTDAAIEDFKKVYLEGMKKMYTDMLGDAGAEALGYDSIDAFVEAFADESMDTDELKQSKSFKYEIKDGAMKFTADDVEVLSMKYEFTSNSELKFTEVKSADNTDFSFPTEMILKK